MRFLALTLSGAQQSWSPTARFTTRTAGTMPTLSGVTGLVLSAMGYHRDNSEGLEKLSGLTMAVRIDDSGTVLRDYQSVQTSAKENKIVHRYYLQNAKFYAVLYADGNDNVLEEMAEAFQKPQNILFLGRKSCPPSGRIFHGIVEADSVENALSSLPYLGDEKTAGMDENIRLDAWIPGDSGEDATLIPDVPVSFSVSHREYTSRIISKISVHVRNPFHTVTHDPMDFEEGINVHL